LPGQVAPAHKGEEDRPLDPQQALICWIVIIVITVAFVFFIAIA
jgi:hypothetical protein